MACFRVLGLTLFCMILAACSGAGSSVTPTPPVVPTNIAPVAQNVSASVQQDSTGNAISLSAADADGNALTYAVGTQPSSGTVSISGNTASYTPNAGFSGTDSFTYTANDGSASSNTATVDVTIVASAGFAGKTNSTNGTPLSGVQIEALDAAGAQVLTEASDGGGEFSISGEAGTVLTLKFTSAGYANQVAVVSLPDLPAGELPLDITMIARPAAQSINVDTGGAVSDANGTSVTVSASSFVDASGNAVTGDIDVTMTPVNTAEPTIFPSFPGEFLGIEQSSGAETAIATLGTVEYVFTQSGAPLQLATGQTARIEMPLWTSINPQTGDRVEAGDVIPLWSLNEDTGIWEQENTGVVVFNLDSPTGYVLQADVSHFTWWNIDYPLPTAQVEVSLTGGAGEGVGAVFASTDAPGYRASRRSSSVVSGGSTSGLIPANYEACFWVDYVDLSGSSAQTAQQCIANPVEGASYSLSFAVNILDPLKINEPSYRTVYSTSDYIEITLAPETLETSVSYAVTAGSLPSGLTLAASGSTYGEISGTVTTPGTYQFTITATDAGGTTDDIVISFDVATMPPPVLQSNQGVISPLGAPVAEPIAIINIGFSPPTTWAVTNLDDTPVRAGVTITSSGVFMMDAFFGGNEDFKVKAFSAAGPSNVATFTVTDGLQQ